MFDQNILLKSIIKLCEINQCGLKTDNIYIIADWSLEKEMVLKDKMPILLLAGAPRSVQ